MQSKRLGFVAVFTCVLVAVASLAAEKSATSKTSPLAGAWKITTVGKQGGMNTKAEALSQTIALTFNEKAVKGKMIEGKPFGFAIVSSHYSDAKPGGNVTFTTTYKMMSNVPIGWHGKLSEDGTKITDGKFSFMLGSGTFTAEKAGSDAKKSE